MSTISKSLLLVCVVVLAAVGVYLMVFPSAEKVPLVRKITIAQAGDFFLYAPLYVASDAGLFAQNGLDVALVSTGGDEKTWAAVISGNAQFGVADPTFVAVAGARGQPGKVIASIVNGVPFWGITLDPSIESIKDPKQLSGKRIATFPSPSTAYTLQKKMFLDAGLQPNIREGSFGTLIAMLKAKQADIALELEPNVSQAVRDGAHIVFGLPEIYGDFAITGLTTAPSTIAKDAELAKRTVCAISQAIEYIRTKPGLALAILQKRFPEIAPEVAKAALSRVTDAGIIPKTVAISNSAWEKAIALRIEIGDLKPADLGKPYVDNQFADDAARYCK